MNERSMAMKNILRYPGAKWRIVPWILEHIPKHHSYVEAYFGSGAVFFNKEKSNIETINDIDNDVVNLFEVIRKNADELVRQLEMIPYSRAVYERAFKEHTQDSVQRAVNLLIRAWQGHGFKTCTKTGWKNDVQGREKAYCVHNWNRLPAWILEVVERLKEVQIENRPALEVIRRHNFEKCFIYLDPPYLLDTRAGKQYKYEMSEEEHIDLLECIIDMKAKIMISGYDNDLYNKYLKDWNTDYINCQKEYGGLAKEKVWFNYEYQSQQRFNF